MTRARWISAVAVVALGAACGRSTSTTNGNAGGAGKSSSAGTAGVGGTTGGSGGSAATPGAGRGGASVAGASGSTTTNAGAGGAAEAAGAGGSEAETGGASSSSGTSGGGMPGATGGTAGNEPGGGQGGEGVMPGTPTEDVVESLPRVRQEHSVVAAAGKIYVLGGYESRGVGLMISDSVMAYDPVADSWDDVKAFPSPMIHGNAGVVNDKIYVAGFYANGMTQGTTQVMEYDPAMGNYTQAAPMPEGTERGAGCVAVDNGLLYVIGGAKNGMSVATATRYDVDAGMWETLPDLPEQRELCAAGAIDGVIYVAGGREASSANSLEKTWAFDVAKNRWLEKAPLMPARSGLAGAVLGGRLFVFGGEGNAAAGTDVVYSDIDAYDPTTNTWEKVGEMDTPRHAFGAATLNGKIYLAGGANKAGDAAVSSVRVFSLE